MSGDQINCFVPDWFFEAVKAKIRLRKMIRKIERLMGDCDDLESIVSDYATVFEDELDADSLQREEEERKRIIEEIKILVN